MSEKSFNVANIEFNSEIYGPGCRTVIWLQGCTLNCHKCWNVKYQSTTVATLIKREDLLDIIITHGCPVTFLGGEPLQQSDCLEWIIKKLKEVGTHIMLYTGYELSEIDSNHQFKRICNDVDILIPGRYIDEIRDVNLTWRGSRNQPIISKSKLDVVESNQIEIIINADGSITCLGYPDHNIIDFIEHYDYSK